MMLHKLNILIVTIALLLSVFLIHDKILLIKVIGVILLVFFLILSLGVIWLRLNYFNRNICKLNTNEVLLTFDDGPNSAVTPKVLEILKKYNIKAIFFMVGKHIESNKKIVQRIIEEGHLIGNHSFNHYSFFAFLSKKKVQEEMVLFDRIMDEQHAYKTKLFRPPIGFTNPNIAYVTKQNKLKLVGWSARSFDTFFKNENILKKRLRLIVKPGNIVLLHDNLEHTAAVLENFITTSKKNGLVFVSSESITNCLI